MNTQVPAGRIKFFFPGIIFSSSSFPLSLLSSALSYDCIAKKEVYKGLLVAAENPVPALHQGQVIGLKVTGKGNEGQPASGAGPGLGQGGEGDPQAHFHVKGAQLHVGRFHDDPGGEAQGAEALVQDPAPGVAGVPGRQDQGKADDLPEAEALGGRQGMVPWGQEDGDQRLPAPGGQLLGHQRFQGQAEIDLAFFHQVQDRRLGAVQEGEVDLGKLPAVGQQRLGQQAVQGGEGCGQAQGSLVGPLELVELFFKGFIAGQQGPGKLQELFAGRGEAQAVAQALQEEAVELRFQGPDLLAQGGLAPEGGRRRLGKAAQPGHLVEA